MRNLEKNKSENTGRDSNWDTLYRDQAVADGMTAAMRFREEKARAKEAEENAVDPEEVEWYQSHPEKISDLIDGDDPEKVKWYREHPDKIDQLISEKNKRKKIEVTSLDDDSDDTLEEEDTVINIPREENDDTAGEKTDSGDDEADKKIDPWQLELENAVDEGRMTAEKAQALLKHRPGNLTSEKINRIALEEQRDKAAVGTPEEQARYQEWLRSRDIDNLRRLEGREEHIIESDAKFRLHSSIIKMEAAADYFEKMAGEDNLSPELIEKIQKYFNTKMENAKKAAEEKLAESKERDAVDAIDKNLDAYADWVAKDTKDKKEIEDREKREQEEREKREQEEKEKREQEEREKREQEEKESNNGKEKKRGLKAKFAEINRKLKELFSKKEEAQKKLEDVDLEIGRIVEKRRALAGEDNPYKSMTTDSSENVAGKSGETAPIELTDEELKKAREIQEKINAVKRERRDLSERISELREWKGSGEEQKNKQQELKELVNEAEKKRLEEIDLSRELAPYLRSADIVDMIKGGEA